MNPVAALCDDGGPLGIPMKYALWSLRVTPAAVLEGKRLELIRLFPFSTTTSLVEGKESGLGWDG